MVLRARGQPGRLSGVLGTMLRSIVSVEPKRNVLVSSDHRTRIRTTETMVAWREVADPRFAHATRIVTTVPTESARRTADSLVR